MVTGLSLDVTGLVPGVEYACRIITRRANRDVVVGDARFYYTKPTPHAAPTGVAVTASDSINGGLTVTWSAVTPSPALPDDEEMRYQVDWRLKTADDSEGWLSAGDFTVLRASLVGTPGSVYEIRIRAESGTGQRYNEGDWSDVVEGTAPVVGPLPNPTLTATPSTTVAGQVEVSWTAVAGAAGYELSWRAVQSSRWTTVARTASQTSWTHAARVNQEYEYHIVAYATGNTRRSSGVRVRATARPLPLPAPRVLGVEVSSTGGQLDLSWTSVAGAGGYTLQRRRSDARSAVTTIDAGSGRSYSDTGLDSAHSYEYRLQAKDAGGFGGAWTAWSDPQQPGAGTGGTPAPRPGDGNGETPPPSPAVPATPGGFSMRQFSFSRSATASWNASPGATYYEIEWTPPSSSSGSPTRETGTSTVRGLFPYGGTVRARIRACNASGCSGWSGYRTATIERLF